MLKTQNENRIRTSLIKFKPRSVLLLLANQKSSMNMNMNKKKTLVHHSISLYLHNNGFSKTLKKFLSESNLHHDDSWKDCSLDLEQVIYKCLETRSQPNTNSDGVEQVSSDVLTKSSNGFGNEPLLDESNRKSKDKKKKKSKSGSDSIVENGQTEAQPVTKEKSKDLVPSEKKSETDSESIKPKDKKKKKEKLISDSLAGDVEQGVDKCINVEEKSVKSKSKKKLKDGLVLQSLPDKEVDKLDKGKSRNNSEKKDFETSEDVVTNTENRDSRKRKRLVSEENKSEPVEKVANDECKRRKTEGMEESQPNKQLDSQTNGNLERHGENSSVQKSLKKQHNGSVEPKTVHAFQRVKMDKVVFTDERLQDNSYWAKDGAEIGYGAKAQEVLGQVRGRDFRHEKTKKKRGSYRGGQIDEHSHSVKFNYSDED